MRNTGFFFWSTPYRTTYLKIRKAVRTSWNPPRTNSICNCKSISAVEVDGLVICVVVRIVYFSIKKRGNLQLDAEKSQHIDR
jgi:hypothetical protein